MRGAVLAANRKETVRFIAEDPVELVLVRKERTTTSDGGIKTGDPVPQPVQTFRMLPASGPSSDVRLTSGSLAQSSYVLMGAWDCDMAREDTFEHEGIWYTISGPVEPEHSDFAYQRKAPVTRNG